MNSPTALALKSSTGAAAFPAVPWRFPTFPRLDCLLTSPPVRLHFTDHAAPCNTRAIIFVAKASLYHLLHLRGDLISVARPITLIRIFTGRPGKQRHPFPDRKSVV